MSPMLIWAGVALSFLNANAQASEGGIGRPITGMQAASFSGLIPPTPGWNMQLGYVHYSGDFSSSREIPIGGFVSAGLEVTLDMATVTGVYVWNTGEGRVNFASMATVPFISIDAEASASLNQFGRTVSDSNDGLFDAFFAPVIASYHFDEMHHASLSLYIYAPTGSYEPGRLANPSLNTWTFSPTVGYTLLALKGGLEWSTTAAMDIYTENDDTNYQNGAVFRVDSVVALRFPNGWGAGVVGGWIEQIEDDEGVIADRLGGFKGRSLGIGPQVTYARRWDGGQVEFSFRWVKEFEVKNRLKGEPLMLSAVAQF